MTTAESLATADFQDCFDSLPEAPGWLAEVRARGQSRYRELGFPHARQEAWRFTDLTPLRKSTFRLAEVSTPGSVDGLLGAAEIADLRTARLVFVDGIFQPDLSSLEGLGPEVLAMSLHQAIAEGHPQARQALASPIVAADLPFAALNEALLGHGALIHLPRNVHAAMPIELIYLASEGSAGRLSAPRNLVVLEAGSSATLIETYLGVDEADGFTNAVTDVRLAEASNLDHYKLLREGNRAFHLAAMAVRQERDSVLTSHGVTIGGRIARNDIQVFLDGTGCSCTLNGLYLGAGRQLLDNHTVIEHRQPYGESHQMYKGILDDQSHGVFNGRIHVLPDAQKTNALQTNRALLLSPRAIVNTKPELLILADDVKCTHGATIGQLDESAVFYLRSRGIAEAEARAMLTCAFGGEAIDDMKLEAVREAVTGLMLGKFQQLAATR